MKIKNIVISLVMLSVLSAFSDPFNSEWDWEGAQNIRGKVKTITTPRKVEKFNERGQKTLSKSLGKDGAVKYETTLLYNNSGKLWKIIRKKAGENTPIYTEIASYNSKGVMESVKREGGMGHNGSTENIEYDANGHLDSISIKTGSTLMTWRYNFSKEGILQSSKMMTDETVKSEAICTSNTKGDQEKVEISRNGKPSQLIEIDYQYDDHGNWIVMVKKITVYREDKIIKPEPLTKTRTLEYY